MPDLTQEITFLKGGVNTDDDPRYFDEGDVIFAENNVMNEMGNVGSRVNIKGNKQITVTLPQIPITGSAPVFSPGLDGTVYGIVIQPDAKIIAVGSFTHYNGKLYNRIIRFNIDGSVDNSFSIGTGFNGVVRTILIYGSIYIGGEFTSYNGTNCNHIVSLNLDGSINTSFNYGTGFDGNVYSIIKLFSGELLVGGQFDSYRDYYNTDMVKIKTDGSHDITYIVGGFNNSVYCLMENPRDFRIHVGGTMTKYRNVFSCNGYMDLSVYYFPFDNRTFSPGAVVLAMAYQSDGKVLIGGIFSSFNGVACMSIVRLSPDEINQDSSYSVDSSFVTGTGFNQAVDGITIQPDGKILVCGSFDKYNGVSCGHIVRLNIDGTIDNSFIIGSGFDNTSKCVAIQSDSKLIYGGDYTTYQGISVNKICRLTSVGAIDNETIVSEYKDNKVKIVGHVNDYKRNSVILHLYSYSGAHCIISLNFITQEITDILVNESTLNYQPDKQYRVDSRIVDDTLVWTDNYNPVRSIIIPKAINYTKYTKATGQDTYSDAILYTISSDNQVFAGHIYKPLKNTQGNVPSGTIETTEYWEYIGDTYYSIDESVLGFLNRPFEYPLTVLGYKSNPNYKFNNLRRQQFQFAIRIISANNGKSVLSPISKIPIPENEQYANGQFVNDDTINNEIELYSYYSTLPEWRKIELYVRNGNNAAWALYDTIDKRGFYYYFDFTVTGTSGDTSSEMTVTGVPESVTKRLFIGQYITGVNQPWGQSIVALTDTTITFRIGFQGVQTVTATPVFIYYFRNDIIGQTADTTEMAKLEDAVPQLSRSVETAENVIILAGNTEGYDNIEPKMSLHPYMVTDTSYMSSTTNFVSQRLYNADNDTYLVVNSLPLIVGALYSLNITIRWGGKGGEQSWIREHIVTHICQSGETVKDILNDFASKILLIPWYNSLGDAQYDSDGNIDPLFSLVVGDGHTPHITDTELKMWQRASWGDGTEDVFAPTNIICIQTVVHKSLKENSKYSVGIEYSDVYGRNSYVMLSDIDKLSTGLSEFTIPYNSTSHISPRFNKQNNRYLGFNYEINSTPPSWAHDWQLVMTDRQSESSFYQGYVKTPFIGTYAPASTWDQYKNSITDVYKDINGNFRLKINRAISATNSVEGDNTIVPEYEYQDGDRIRFIACWLIGSNSNTMVLLDDTISYDILGQEYPNTDLQYKKDYATTESYILDSNGNKISDIATAEIILSDIPALMQNGSGNRTSQTPSGRMFIYEIYSAPKAVENELYYEIGEKYYCGDGIHHANYKDQGIAQSGTFGLDHIFATDPSVSGTHYLAVKFNAITLADLKMYNAGDEITITQNILGTVHTTIAEVYINQNNGEFTDYSTGSYIMLNITCGAGDYYTGGTISKPASNTNSAYGYVDSGDVYVKMRYGKDAIYYPVESSNASDFYKSDSWDKGRPFSVNPTARRQYINNIRYGYKYQQDTQVNGLATFDYVNEIILDNQYGVINGLCMTGFVLNVLQERKLSAVYIGRLETYNQGTTKDMTLTTTDKFLGSVRPSTQNYGLQQRDSYLGKDNYLYFTDFNNKCICRKSEGGIEEISAFKMNKYFKDLFTNLLANGFNTVDIQFMLDDTNNFLYVYILDEDTGNIYIPIFNEGGNRWVATNITLPGTEYVLNINRDMYVSRQNGDTFEIWHHADDSADRNNFYGTQYDSKLILSTNQHFNNKKLYKSIALHSNKAWDVPEINVEKGGTHTWGIFSWLKKAWFRLINDTWYCDFKRNAKTHNSIANIPDLYNGEHIRGNTMEVTLTNDDSEMVKLNKIDINYEVTKF